MKKILTLLMMSILALGLVACSDSKEEEKDKEAKDDDAEKSVVTVEHELDKEAVEVPVNPEKVVVFDFGTLDTIDKLGGEVVGVPKQTVPSYLEKFESDEYENVGGLKEPDFEKIANIAPDLIIISGRQAEVYDQFKEIAPTIYLDIDTENYMASFESNVKLLGEIYAKEAEAEAAFNEVVEQIDATKEKTEASKNKGLIVLANDDKISAYGPSSRFGIIHDVLGVEAADEGIEVSTHGMNVTFEYVTEKDPDILYVVDRGAAVGTESSAKVVVENKLMEKTKAYKNDKIIYLDPDFWYLSNGGLTSVSEMVKEVSDSLD